MFRAEFRKLIQRIASFKFGANEIMIIPDQSPSQNTISDLKNIKEEIEKSTLSDINTIDLIDHKIRNRSIVALSNIKTETTYLWPALLKANENSDISVPIRQSTVLKITKDLNTLMYAGLFFYEIETTDGWDVNELLVHNISLKLIDLIQLVEKEY